MHPTCTLKTATNFFALKSQAIKTTNGEEGSASNTTFLAKRLLYCADAVFVALFRSAATGLRFLRLKATVLVGCFAFEDFGGRHWVQ